MKIAVRLSLLVLIIPLLVLVISLFISDKINYDRVLVELRRYQESKINEVSARLETLVYEKAAVVKGIANNATVRQYLRQTGPNDVNLVELQKYPEFDSIFKTLTDSAKEYNIPNLYFGIESSDFLFVNDMGAYQFIDNSYKSSTRNWYKGAKSTRQLYFAEPSIGTTTGTFETNISYPVIEGSKLLGVVGTDVSFIEIEEVLTKISENLDSYSYLYLYTEKGDLLSHPLLKDEQLSLKELAENVGIDDPEGFARDLVGESGFLEVRVNNSPRLNYFSEIGNTGWYVGMSVNIDEAAAESVGVSRFVIIGLGAILVAVFLIVLALINVSIVKPIKQTTDLMSNIAEGDGDLRVELPEDRSDELGLLAAKFNLFVKKIKGVVTDSIDVSGASQDIKVEVLSSTEETAASVTEISSNVASIDNLTNQLDMVIDSSNKTVGNISQYLSDIGGKIDDQAAMVEESTAAITQMMSSLHSVSDITKKRRDGAQELNSKSSELEDYVKNSNETFQSGVAARIDTIQEMVDIIKAISDQTNLLAMNAAIEAAHAGEAGKGFAVVSDEIRKLAEQSRESSATISDTIQAIVESISITSEYSTKSSNIIGLVKEEVQKTVESFQEIQTSTEELTQGSKQILDAMAVLSDATTVIKDESKEILQAAESLKSEQSNVVMVSKETSSGMREINSGVNEINDAVIHISELSHKLGDFMDTLNNVLGKFKV